MNKISQWKVHMYLLFIHDFPSDCHSSSSLDVKQFSNNCLASWVMPGLVALSARSRPPCTGSRLASYIRLSGVNKKWTSSGALGSWMCAFSFANRLNANLNFSKMSMKSSAGGGFALIFSIPSVGKYIISLFSAFILDIYHHYLQLHTFLLFHTTFSLSYEILLKCMLWMHI